MPYIKGDWRRWDIADGQTPVNVGDLTYLLTHNCISYLHDKKADFARHAEVLAALEATKLEFYRRAVAPYENEKIKENGDVYPAE